MKTPYVLLLFKGLDPLQARLRDLRMGSDNISQTEGSSMAP